MIKKKYEGIITESIYMNRILNNINNNKNSECIICLDKIKNSIMTFCGHFYCHDCFEQAFKINKICPLCKSKLNPKDFVLLEKDSNIYNKYGSKMSALILLLKDILINTKNKILIFSQWDDLLNLISRILLENNIHNSFIKGNINYRNNCLKQFNENNNNIIMLSLKNCASGSNLQNATHIIFIEPINDSIENIQNMENQAICRAHRIGQENTIKIIRILIKDTIEEDIYNSKYAHM